MPAAAVIYSLSLHDALPIFAAPRLPAVFVGHVSRHVLGLEHVRRVDRTLLRAAVPVRSEEHTSELQSQSNLVCRLLLEKKNPLFTLLFPLVGAVTGLSGAVIAGRVTSRRSITFLF